MPQAMAPTMFGAGSAYLKDYGEDCSDPMERSAPSERFQSRMTTGRDLAAGSTRASNHPPGYTGHIAANKCVREHLSLSERPFLFLPGTFRSTVYLFDPTYLRFSLSIWY